MEFFADVFTAGGLAALGQVIMIDLMLAGDNVVILGTLAAGLPAAERKRVLTLGVGIALVCLVGFAFLAVRLLDVVGLRLAGGLLLLWVGWKLFRELRGERAPAAETGAAETGAVAVKPAKSFARAAIQVAIADLSMSLDNVLAVAGAARNHPAVLFFGLALSVTLMAVAANYIARIIERHHWIAYAGLAVIVYVAGSMIVDGGRQMMPLIG
ncbi:YjbE family putative metal transport protein [Polymorphobacter sp. PAMC 29334]|uniref:YjbE family putative metal transport protein n=1 Tax=Polymorphobacter sp. PAMC 29334 TaxID=2862331 RepID=UPI001C788A4E|nr:YjbE family putative metal transport protein [Polymorphobacter sp. PAMC 29334]QYE34641.1 YjbE family putative metal transport protein [Polymorphobacter sp. PAMC 29334]